MPEWMQRLLNADQGEGGTPPSTEPAEPIEPAKPKTDPPPATDDGGGKGSKEAVLKDLAGERDRRQAAEGEVKTLKEEMVKMKKQQDERDVRLRQALGVETEEDPIEVMKHKAESNERLAREALVKSAVIAEASKQGAVDPDDVFALIDRSELDIDFEKLSVSGVDQAVKNLLEKKPHLKGGKPSQPAGAQPPSSDPDGDQLDREKLTDMVKRAKKGDDFAAMQVSKNLKRIKELKIEV